MASSFEWNIDLSQVVAEARERAEKIEARVAHEVAEAIQELTPVDTGKLRDSIHAYPTATGWAAGTSVDYALHVNAGTPFRAGAHMFERGLDRLPEIINRITREEL